MIWTCLQPLTSTSLPLTSPTTRETQRGWERSGLPVTLSTISCTPDANWFITHTILSLFLCLILSHSLALLWGGVGFKHTLYAVTLQWVMDGGVWRAAVPCKHSCSMCFALCVVSQSVCMRAHIPLSLWPPFPLLCSSTFPLTLGLSDTLANTL